MGAFVDFIFQATRPAHSKVSLHRHNCYELVYYQSGSGVTHIANETYRYEPGTYALIYPETLHDEIREQETEVLFLGFSLHQWELPQPEIGFFRDDERRTVETLLQDIELELRSRKAHYQYKLDMLLGALLVEHLRKGTPGRPAIPDKQIGHVCRYLDEHYNSPIRVEELAAMAGYSYHHFRHVFRSMTGVSPMTYIMSKRLEQARRLLRHSDMPLTAIASECGFSNDAQLSTVFKREFGETPREYRKSSLQNTLNRGQAREERWEGGSDA